MCYNYINREVMKKEILLLGALTLSLSAFATGGVPDNMQVWLKNGEQRSFEISQVDSVTFGGSQSSEYTPLTVNTLPPTFNSLIRLW